MLISSPTVFTTSVSEHAKYRDAMLIKNGKNFVIKKVRRLNRGLFKVKLGKAKVRKSIDTSLLINLSDSFNRPYKISVLSDEKA